MSRPFGLVAVPVSREARAAVRAAAARHGPCFVEIGLPGKAAAWLRRCRHLRLASGHSGFQKMGGLPWKPFRSGPPEWGVRVGSHRSWRLGMARAGFGQRFSPRWRCGFLMLMAVSSVLTDGGRRWRAPMVGCRASSIGAGRG